MKTVPLGSLIAPAKSVRAGKDTYPVLSITMHEGLVFQQERFKKAIAGKDLSSYKVVKRGQLVVGFPIDEAVLDFQEITGAGIVSPAYGVWDVVDPEAVDSNYLGKYLRSPQAISYYKLRLRGTTARRRSLTRGAFEAFPILLPSLAEQQRIAEILDTISSNLASRKTQLEQLSILQKSTFERFHLAHLDQATKYHFQNVVPRIDSGKSPVCESRPAADNEWGVLKLSAVTTGEFLQDENKAYLEDTESLSHLEIQPGDLLMTRKNTPELVGAVSLVRETRPNLLFPDLIFRLNLNKDLAKPEYLAALLMSPPVRFSIRSLAGGSAKSMSNISKQRLNKLLIDLPPLNAQREFVTKSQEIQAIKRKVNSAYKLDQELLASLQAHAFAGQL